METLGIFKNLDLLSVGISIAGIGILGFVVFFNNRRSITNRTFIFFALAAIFWSISNYLIYQFQAPDIILKITRLHMFFSVLYSFFIFRLFYVFPYSTFKFAKIYRNTLLPIAVLTAVLTLTPLVLSRVTEIDVGEVAVIRPGPGIFVFGIVVFSLIVSGIVLLARKMKKSPKTERAQFKFVLFGAAFTFALHLAFNFILPIIFVNPRFVPFGAVFTFPFVALTSYAIFKHHLLNVKIITTEVLTFILAVTTLFEVILAEDVVTRIFRSGVFALVLAFGILLIKSVLREVRQREELQILNEKLNKANTELESLSRFKTQLLSLASHQVKSPLAAIKGFVTLVMDGTYGPVSEKVKEVMEKVKHSSDNLINLINDLLDFRKVEEGKMEYQFAKVGLREMVNSVVENLRSLAQEKNLELTFTGPKVEIFVNADSPKLQQVIQNLVDNAVKYTPSGFVRVKTEEPSSNEVIVLIQDSGLGISKKLLPHLFEEFVRDEKVKQEIRGTGLGLFIARKIVEAHGGELWAESDGEGKGSRFFVRLKKII